MDEGIDASPSHLRPSEQKHGSGKNKRSPPQEHQIQTQPQQDLLPTHDQQVGQAGLEDFCLSRTVGPFLGAVVPQYPWGFVPRPLSDTKICGYPYVKWCCICIQLTCTLAYTMSSYNTYHSANR